MPVNAYETQLTAQQVEAGLHRAFVGGLWDVIGPLQADYLISRGLKPGHRLIDMGCGALRGGVNFARYLDAGHYYGVDINASLIAAGRLEAAAAGLADKRLNLAVSNSFDATGWDVKFDYGIAQSLFTHLTHELIGQCLSQLRKVMNGPFYATYFEAPHDGYGDDITHPQGTVTHYLQDPYHISFDELSALANQSGMTAERIGAWGHPKSQSMAVFRPSTD